MDGCDEQILRIPVGDSAAIVKGLVIAALAKVFCHYHHYLYAAFQPT